MDSPEDEAGDAGFCTPHKEADESNVGGRPRLEFDLDQVEKLAGLACTYDDLAGFFDCSVRTIKDRMKNDPEFIDAFNRGQAKGKVSLRKKQYEEAMRGNKTMLVWLGKNWLGQTDKIDHKHEGEVLVKKPDAKQRLLDRLDRRAEAARAEDAEQEGTSGEA